MKILIIQVGNFEEEKDFKKNITYYKFPTLLFGDKFFDQQQGVNNVQTRESLEKAGHEVIYYFHTHRKSLKYLILSSLKIRKLCKIHRPDLTHIFYGGVSGFLAGLFVRGKSVVSLLGSDLYGSYNDSGRKVLGSIVQTTCSRLLPLVCTRVIVMSNGMKSFMWPILQKKIVVIPEGISLDKFDQMDKSLSREKLGWAKDSFIVIFFYRGQGVKNLPLAQKAFDVFKSNSKKTELKLISGYKHADLKYVYSAADCMLMTSYHEGSNNSIKEAMACNLPVVTVFCGDAEERLKDVHNSYFVEYDHIALAKKLLIVYEYDERSDGRNHLNEVLLDVCTQKINELYTQLD
ncbi:MAG: glycosyltransferase involved in cell wall biosynthesis [Arcticibacterium sp.]|jgi:glycosyltransferase involved in cell wall biosynthesis